MENDSDNGKIGPLLSDHVERLTKLSAAAAGVTYVLGFLIRGLYLAQYGITDTDPIRPRILAAGVTFAALSTFGCMMGRSTAGLVRSTSAGERRLNNRTFLMAFMVLEAGSAGVVLNSVLYDDPYRGSMWSGVAAWPVVALLAGGTLLLLAIVGLQRSNERPKSWSGIAVLAGLLLITGDCFIMEKRILALQAWLYVTATIPMIVSLKQLDARRFSTVGVNAILYIVALMSFYALQIHPSIRRVWGGGAPVQATLHFVSSATKDKTVDLIEEDTEGYYFVTGPKQAEFVRRESVDGVQFNMDRRKQ